MITEEERNEIEALLPAPTPMDRLEDALAVYFGDECPVGSCRSRVDAERLLAEHAHRALERSP